MDNIKDFIDFHAEQAGMTREEYTAYYLSEKKSGKLTALWLTYNDANGRLYKATFKYSNGEEIKLRQEGIKEIEQRIKDAFGLKVDSSNISGIESHEDEMYKIAKKLKIDLTIYEHDLS